MNDDADLLRRYAKDHSEEAFAELVRRHLGLVYHAAWRLTGDPHRAEDVAQAVFTDLARKAASLTSRPSLAGWLYTSTRYAAAHARRTERRRQIREQEAFAMNDPLQPQTSGSKTDWTQVRPVLDAALHDLGERDREAVLLRFLEGRPFSEIGAKLALTEDAARMRVDRALEKIRRLLARRGVTSTSAALAVVLADQAGAAVPTGLAVKITTTAIALHAAAGGAAAGLGILTFMTTGKILTGVAVLALGTALLYETGENRKIRDALAASQQQQAELLAKLHGTETDLASANTRLKASEEDGAKLLGALDSAAAGKAAAAAEPRVPITHDYVESRYKHAQALAKNGQNEEALKEFLWCYDEGMAPLPEYTGVRQSYLLEMIAKLGEKYPPALAALRERRDQTEQRLQASANDFAATMSFASLNRVLKEGNRTLQFYDQLPAKDPRKQVFGMMVYEDLTTAQRYRDATQAMPYQQMNSMVDAFTTSPAASLRPAQRAEVAEDTAKFVEVLAGTGDLVHARTLADRLLAYDGSVETKTILQQHATRAGHPELFTTAVTP
jgi:RNA polymerase sigma factor (sigma-70 family)